MVKAFFVHTLLPGRCTILYSRCYGGNITAASTSDLPSIHIDSNSVTSDTLSLSSRITLDSERISLASSSVIDDQRSVGTSEGGSLAGHPGKQLLVNLAKEVQAQYAFKSSVSGRSYDQDIHRLNTDGILPDLEQGYVRYNFDSVETEDTNSEEKVVIWMGALNTGFCLVCHKNENRLLAEKLLKVVIKRLQEYCRAFNHPTEIVSKPDRVSMVIDQYLPNGVLLFLTYRGIRQFDKEIEKKMKLTSS